MGTQKTGKGTPPTHPGTTWNTGDDDVIDASKAGEDLGLKKGEAFEPDPKGFEPSSEHIEMVSGRGMIPLSREDLANLHQTHAPNQSMVSDPFQNLSDRPIKDHSEAYGDDMEEDNKRNYRESSRRDNVSPEQIAGELMDEFEPTYTSSRTSYKSQSQTEKNQEPTIDVDVESLDEAARVLEAVINKANQAREEGDMKMASELTSIAQRIVAGSKLKRHQEEKPRHPALKKLLNNLGLEKIKSTDIEWLGSTWRFAARSAPMDYWLGSNTGQEGLELNAAIIAAGLVGLDDEKGTMHPIWKVHNIALTAEYLFETPNQDEDLPPIQEKVNIPVYRKMCESCSCEVKIDDDKCEVCGAIIDPFDLPLDLRLRCAEATLVLLTEKLGLDAPDLGDLVSKYREVMPDRRFDKEEVFPFVKLLLKQETIQS